MIELLKSLEPNSGTKYYIDISSMTGSKRKEYWRKLIDDMQQVGVVHESSIRRPNNYHHDYISSCITFNKRGSSRGYQFINVIPRSLDYCKGYGLIEVASKPQPKYKQEVEL